MRNFTQRWPESGHFLSKLGHFFHFSKKGRRLPPPPSSYAPVRTHGKLIFWDINWSDLEYFSKHSVYLRKNSQDFAQNYQCKPNDEAWKYFRSVSNVSNWWLLLCKDFRWFPAFPSFHFLPYLKYLKTRKSQNISESRLYESRNHGYISMG